MKQTIILRKVAGVFAALRRGYGMSMRGSSGGAMSLGSIAGALCLMLIPVMLALVLLVALVVPHTLAGLTLAVPTLAVDKKKLTDLLTEAEKIQNDHKGKNMPEDVGTKFDTLMTEAKGMQDALDAQELATKREQQLDGFKRWSREIPDPVLPGDPGKTDERKNEIAGYVTTGALFALSPEFGHYVKSRMPMEQGSSVVHVKNLLPIRGATPNLNGLVALTNDEVKQYRSLIETKSAETKAAPVFGTDVIAPNRVDRLVQDLRPDVLTLRDVLNVSPTSSPVIDYIAEVSYTEAAAIVSEGAAKPPASTVYEKRRANTVVIAVYIPATEQQLSDAPALINRINNRLLWDVHKAEEQQIGYGVGTGENFTGFFDGTNVDEMREESGDTLLDIFRRGMTDVLTSGYNPDFGWLHPEDWETMELAKGSDGHYVWAIIRDVLGPRLWGTRVVQGVGTRKRGTTTTNMLVGDGRLGATLYDQMQATIKIGWINDQFIKNTRTILAEERVAFALEAPLAFRKFETAA
jgi:HK97 family phage major capsid protein